MQTEQLQQQVEILQKKVAQLEASQIQINIDPTTLLYLQQAVGQQIYGGTTTPTGTNFPKGSIYFVDDASLANRKIYVFTGTTWQQMK